MALARTNWSTTNRSPSFSSGAGPNIGAGSILNQQLMLVINGTVNGTLYEEKSVKPEVLIKAFKIPPMNGTPKTFKLILGTNLMRKDRNNPGSVLITPGLKMGPEFTVTTNDGSLTIRYATSKTPIPGGGGTYRYMPKKMSFIKGQESFYFGDDRIEEYVWAFLHPSNKQSPFSKPNRPPSYQYFDPVEEALNTGKKLMGKMDVMQAIMVMEEQELRLRAAGLSYLFGTSRISFPGAAKIETGILRSQLIQAANAHEDSFLDAWAASGDSVIGLAKIAEAAGVIQQVPVNGGTEWRFSQQYGGARIAFAYKDQDPLSILVSELSVNQSSYTNRIKSLISGKQPQTPAQPEQFLANDLAIVSNAPDSLPPAAPLKKKDLDEMDAAEFVQHAEEMDVIGIERAQSKAFILNRKTGATIRPLCKVEKIPSWRAEVATHLNSEEGKADRKEITAILRKITN